MPLVSLTLWCYTFLAPTSLATLSQTLLLPSLPAAAKSPQLCPTLCDPVDGSPPGSTIPGILQATTLEWVAISFPNAWKWKVKVKPLRRVRPSATPWTTALQAPLSMGFSRQEYWSGLPLTSSPSLPILPQILECSSCNQGLHFSKFFSNFVFFYCSISMPKMVLYI